MDVILSLIFFQHIFDFVCPIETFTADVAITDRSVIPITLKSAFGNI